MFIEDDKRWALIFFALMGALVARARAGDFTVYAGWANPGKLTLGKVSEQVSAVLLRGSPIYGLRLSNDLARIIGLEHTIAFSNNFLRPEADIQPAAGRVKGFIYNTNLIVNAPIGRAVPYATVGVGLIRPYDSDQSPLLFGTKFAANYGGGLKLRKLAGPLGLRFDVRGYTAAGVFARNWNIFEASGGLLFSW